MIVGDPMSQRLKVKRHKEGNISLGEELIGGGYWWTPDAKDAASSSESGKV